LAQSVRIGLQKGFKQFSIGIQECDDLCRRIDDVAVGPIDFNLGLRSGSSFMGCQCRKQPTKRPEFKRVLGSFLKALRKPQAGMAGKLSGETPKSPVKRGASSEAETA
jgi:hypothetical protein